MVRGEFIISRVNFQEHYKDSNSNPRNLVAGIVNKKKPTKEDLEYLEFVVYEIIEPVMKPSEQ